MDNLPNYFRDDAGITTKWTLNPAIPLKYTENQGSKALNAKRVKGGKETLCICFTMINLIESRLVGRVNEPRHPRGSRHARRYGAILAFDDRYVLVGLFLGCHRWPFRPNAK